MPEVPPLSNPVLKAAASDVFAPGGALAAAIPDFEPREGQIEMARAVERVFADGGVLLAEAGTGTGKTLAYLVPAILSRERVHPLDVPFTQAIQTVSRWGSGAKELVAAMRTSTAAEDAAASST